jgi:hypothetical protein
MTEKIWISKIPLLQRGKYMDWIPPYRVRGRLIGVRHDRDVWITGSKSLRGQLVSLSKKETCSSFYITLSPNFLPFQLLLTNQNRADYVH